MGRIVWMDPFDTRCCSKDTLEMISIFDDQWASVFMGVPEEFTRGMHFTPYRCRLCGRYWFKCKDGFWTVKD